ncbi:hypothetical protein TL16_g07754 [Triparma laevis f. inornata]|uniref:Uncharacterized protein n=1 Tax=Triparma laevis f. inornata TaxID=1714386 RepID=A0A9W7ASE8_9STRA|nr:hypothetical protein TL16_g07754 [Triparma laevis f. inornata]
MAISFCLKPRREDRLYKTLLYTQFVTYTLVSEFLYVVGNSFDRVIARAIASGAFYLLLLKFGIKSRSHFAKLPDKELSHFLTNDVIMGGVIIGLGQLAFLMFGSIQCDGNASSYTECNRTLISQAGLSIMVGLYVMIKLGSGAVPKRILDKHVISTRKILAMEVNKQECIQSSSLTIAALCALYLIGNYGAEGDFEDDAESGFMYNVMNAGCLCLIVTAAWKMFAIKREMRDEKLRRESGRKIVSTADVFLTEASSFWPFLGVLATTCQSTLCVVGAITMDEGYMTRTITSLPFVLLGWLQDATLDPIPVLQDGQMLLSEGKSYEMQHNVVLRDSHFMLHTSLVAYEASPRKREEGVAEGAKLID